MQAFNFKVNKKADTQRTAIFVTSCQAQHVSTQKWSIYLYLIYLVYVIKERMYMCVYV